MCPNIGDCWKGLGIGSTSKCLWNWEAVGVQRMPKVSEVGVEGMCGSVGACWKGLRIGSTLKCLWTLEVLGV